MNTPQTRHPTSKQHRFFTNPNDPRSICSTEDQRWSDVVPPESGLTFAAIYDPEEGLISLSGANIFSSPNAETKSIDSPYDAADTHSQTLSVNLDQFPLPTSNNNTAIRTFFNDAQPYRLGTPMPQMCGQTYARESSTLDGLDMYTQELDIPRGSSLSRYGSIFRILDNSPKFNPHSLMGFGRPVEGVTEVNDEGFFEGDNNRESNNFNLVCIIYILPSFFPPQTTNGPKQTFSVPNSQ